jgi:hypothetical protein
MQTSPASCTMFYGVQEECAPTSVSSLHGECVQDVPRISECLIHGGASLANGVSILLRSLMPARGVGTIVSGAPENRTCGPQTVDLVTESKFYV